MAMMHPERARQEAKERHTSGTHAAEQQRLVRSLEPEYAYGAGS